MHEQKNFAIHRKNVNFALRKHTIQNLNIMAEKRLTKSGNKMIAGVCAGIAEYLGIDVTLCRIAYALLSLFTAFAGVLVYLVLCLIMPEA